MVTTRAEAAQYVKDARRLEARRFRSGWARDRGDVRARIGDMSPADQADQSSASRRCPLYARRSRWPARFTTTPTVGLGCL